MRLGDRGLEVKRAQNLLSFCGFVLDSNEVSEGVFGVSTKRSVIRLQLMFRLTPNGEWSSNLEEKIRGMIS